MSTTTVTTMPAWVQRTYGGVETVALEQIQVPGPRDDEAIVRVHATALNAADARLMHGDPYLVRLGFGLRKPKCAVRGIDLAGTVTALGTAVTGFAIGDEVVAESGGGGLAPFAVQLAALRGAAVWALSGERSRSLVGDLGAVRTFDYRQTGPDSLPKSTFDAIIDLAGTTPLTVLRDLLTPGGTLVMVAGDGGKILGPIPRMIRAAVLPKRDGRRIRSLMAVAKTDVLQELLNLAKADRLRSVIEHTYPFDEADAALRHIDSGRTVGKVVVESRGE
ncbi:MAG: NAD(P)-dependent alcohol dehydrogenase [Leucobacter sp.]